MPAGAFPGCTLAELLSGCWRRAPSQHLREGLPLLPPHLGVAVERFLSRPLSSLITLLLCPHWSSLWSGLEGRGERGRDRQTDRQSPPVSLPCLMRMPVLCDQASPPDPVSSPLPVLSLDPRSPPLPTLSLSLTPTLIFFSFWGWWWWDSVHSRVATCHMVLTPLQDPSCSVDPGALPICFPESEPPSSQLWGWRWGAPPGLREPRVSLEPWGQGRACFPASVPRARHPGSRAEWAS